MRWISVCIILVSDLFFIVISFRSVESETSLAVRISIFNFQQDK